MGIAKQFLKTKPTCKVTFSLEGENTNEAQSAHVVGDFNDWSISAHPMKRTRSGGFKTTIELEKDRSYQFRYLLDQQHWVNDPAADRFTPSPFADSQNSVVIL